MPQIVGITINGRTVCTTQLSGLVFIVTQESPTLYLDHNGGFTSASSTAFIDNESAFAYANRWADLPPVTVEPGKNRQVAEYVVTDDTVPNVARRVINIIDDLRATAPSWSGERLLNSQGLAERLNFYLGHVNKDDPYNGSARRNLLSQVKHCLDALITALERDQPSRPWTRPVPNLEMVEALARHVAEHKQWSMSCKHCGSFTRNKTKREEFLCPGCVHNYCVKCNTCKKAVDTDAAIRIRERGGERYLCPTCAPKDIKECLRCHFSFRGGPFPGENVRAEEVAASPYKNYCPQCTSAVRRLDCGHIFLGGGFERYGLMLSIEDDERPLEESREILRVCQTCRDTDREDGQYAPIFWNPDVESVIGAKHDEVGSARTFGVELEYCQVRNIKKIPKRISMHWSSKHDASLPRSGAELASVILGGNDGLKVIAALCKYASDNKWAVNQRAGMHVHFGLPKENPAQLGAIAVGYLLSTNVWKSFVAPSRKKCKHCIDFQRAPDYYAKLDPKDVLHALTDAEGPERDSHGNGNGRRRWINWFSYRHYKTVELRIHQGTNNYEKIANWIKAHCRFIDWCAEVGDQNEIFKRLSPYRDNTHAMFLAIARWAWKDWELAKWFRERAHKFDEGGLAIRPNKKWRRSHGVEIWIPTPACRRPGKDRQQPAGLTQQDRELLNALRQEADTRRLAAGQPQQFGTVTFNVNNVRTVPGGQIAWFSDGRPSGDPPTGSFLFEIARPEDAFIGLTDNLLPEQEPTADDL